MYEHYPSIERLCEAFDYNRDTGELFWKISVGTKIKAGKPAGERPSTRLKSTDRMEHSARRIRLDNVLMYYHTVAYVIANKRFPEGAIRFADRDRTNTKPDNLVVSTPSDITRSSGREDNKTGYKGVVYTRGIFLAKIVIGPRQVELGRYLTARQAAEVYDAAVLRHFGPEFPTNASLGRY